MGRLPETGISQKTCQKYILFKAFGKKSIESQNDSHLLISRQHKIQVILKVAIFSIVLLISLSLHGQTNLRNDTIIIAEVEIRGKPSWNETRGFRTTSVDSAIIINYGHSTLADLIAENSVIYIKTYGPGGIATPSFRGTGAGHTRISWNGINLNNPMPGQFDLSLVPAGLIDEVSVIYGGGSMNSESGGLGGMIKLITKPDWSDRNILFLNTGTGSFGRYSGLAKIITGNKSFNSVTKAYFNDSENNFRYMNTISGNTPVWETRENNQVSQKGFIQELYYRNSRSTFSARFWYQKASRNLPVPITSPAINPPEKQKDESFRAMLTYETLKRRADINVTAAFVSDRLDYKNELASVDSRNTGNKIILKGDLGKSINELIRVKFSAGNELNIVNSNNYAGNIVRNIVSVDAVAEADIAPWLVSRFLVRELLADNRFLSPDFSASAEIKPFKENQLLAKASISKNSKIPALNDMYWMPGGNAGLNEENGICSEISFEMINALSGSLTIKNDLAFFRNNIRDVIQWHPGEFSYWEADNLDNLLTSGIEAGIDVNYTSSHFSFRLIAGYSFTRASGENDIDGNLFPEGNQHIYVPINQVNTMTEVTWRHFYSTFRTNYTDRRFLTVDNTQYLPEYSVSDLDIGFRLNTKKSSVGFTFTVENIFNINYQNIAYYPMPGRSFLASVVFQLNK